MSTGNPTPDLGLDDFIARYIDKVEDPIEVLMRADFARMQHLRDTARGVGELAEFTQLTDQADEIDQRWSDPHIGDREAWMYLAQAHEDWRSAPQIMDRMCGQMQLDQANGWRLLATAAEWRSQLQARELTGHGAWSAGAYEIETTKTPASSTAEMPWVNEANINTAAPFPVSAEFAAARTRELAAPLPGHAFAGLVNSRDSDREVER
ncbi:hypothetical protein DFR70_1333 [Nocardia tenerifensis]|uniref:Uncharacterized protein n=1 Tax=Nocardia tenerifensis TaxID=228006 RepID=A0A318JL53_9NOCA|nr:hypothetical protein [Nocardia tenerifensis]PXX52271.1 hypothetical protein DFR70_1333 [Nocardia tenerifensis]